MANTITATSGSDISLGLTWKQPSGSPVDISDYTATMLFGGDELTSRFTYDMTDPTNGVMRVLIEGTTPIDIGVYRFRIQITNGVGSSIASQEIVLRVI